MARTDKPATSSDPKPKSNSTTKGHKRKRDLITEQQQHEYSSSSGPAPPSIPCLTISSSESVQRKSGQYSIISERFKSTMYTIDLPPDENEERRILNSKEYHDLTQWLVQKCQFNTIDAEVFIFQLIQHHKITDLHTLYLLLLRDRTFLNTILPIGYLLSLEQQLYLLFYKSLEEITSQELFHLLRNIGLNNNFIELLIFTYEFNGFLLASNYQLEQDLINMNIPPIFVKALVSKVQVWKTTGVPVKDLQPKKSNDEEVARELSYAVAVSVEGLLKRNGEEVKSESKEEGKVMAAKSEAEGILTDPIDSSKRSTEDGQKERVGDEQRHDTSFEVALQECFQKEPINLINDDDDEADSAIKLQELFDLEMMSEFGDDVIDIVIDERGFVTQRSKSSDDSDYVEGQEDKNTEEKTEDEGEENNRGDDTLAARVKKSRRKDSTKFTIKEKAKRRKAAANELSSLEHENVNRNLSLLLMEVRGLKEPAISFFDTLLKKRKREGLLEMIKQRVFPVLIEVIIDPNADESARKKCFQIVNAAVRASTNDELVKFIHLDDSMVLLIVAIKSGNASLMHQSLVLMEQLIMMQIPFMKNMMRLFMKILCREKEKILKARLIKNLVQVIEKSLRLLPLDVNTLIEELPLIIFLFHSKEVSITYKLLQCCSMILEEDQDDLTQYFVDVFPISILQKFLGENYFLAIKEVMNVFEIIAKGPIEHTKRLLQEVPMLVPYVKGVIAEKSCPCVELRELQELAYDIIGSICAGDDEGIQLLVNEAVFPVLFLNFTIYATALLRGLCPPSTFTVVSGKNKSKNKQMKYGPEEEALQCAYAICYVMYGGSEAQIVHLLENDLIKTIDLMLEVFHGIPDIMEELVPGINRILMDDFQGASATLKAMLAQKHYQRIYHSKALIADRLKKKEAEELLIKLSQS